MTCSTTKLPFLLQKDSNILKWQNQLQNDSTWKYSSDMIQWNDWPIYICISKTKYFLFEAKNCFYLNFAASYGHDDLSGSLVNWLRYYVVETFTMKSKNNMV